MDDTNKNPIDRVRHEDEFLSRLKDLGYLENPLDKFFIGGSHGRTGVFTANLKIAAKVGVLGGVFLGVVTALSLGLLTPETFPNAAPLAKLALYFSLIFTVLFAALELVIGLAVTILGRAFRRLFTRTEMIAFYSGVFAGLVVFGYGTLWWAGFQEGAPVSLRAIGAFLIIALLAVGVALLTRRGVTSLLALLGGADLTARGKGRATKLYFAILACGILIFAGYRFATVRQIPTKPSAYDVPEPKLSVTLVAIDGASADFFERMRAKGAIPHLSALAAEGYFATLAAPPLHVNPSVWTTVATGVEPAKHGVTSYSAQEIPGLGLYVKDRTGFGLYDAVLAALPAMGLSERAPLERRSQTYPALWDILAQKGAISGIANWWGTWPATEFQGFLVTDRMYPKLQAAKALHGPPKFEAETYPKTLFDQLADYPLIAAKFAENPLAASQDMDRFSVASLLAGEGNYKGYTGVASSMGAGNYRPVALSAVYLPGLDIYENSLFTQLEDGWNMAAAAAIADGAADYWRYLDGLVEPLIAKASADNVVIVVVDPGMAKSPERQAGRRTAKGFCIIAGGPIVAGQAKVSMRLVDIAPAVLYLLDFPTSGEMDGRVPLEAFGKDFVAAHPVKKIDTFGRLEVKAQGGYSVDAQLVDRLKSLGYLQ